jgi:cyclophilin family peptidyl-prolyl cis-trans isomerase
VFGGYFQGNYYMNRLALLLFAVLSLVGASCSAQLKKVDDSAPYSGPTLDKYCSNPKRLLIMETNLGTIKIQLFDKIAPNHVAQITKLAKEHMYDGIYFHRVYPGFMIQGGDPNTKDNDPSNDGQGGMGERLKAEFSDVHHARGVCSMARTQDPNSATSQFFLCVGDAGMLDRNYTVWGQVVEGYDVLDKICALEKDPKYPRLAFDRNQSINPGKDAMMTKVWVKE